MSSQLCLQTQLFFRCTKPLTISTCLPHAIVKWDQYYSLFSPLVNLLNLSFRIQLKYHFLSENFVNSPGLSEFLAVFCASVKITTIVTQHLSVYLSVMRKQLLTFFLNYPSVTMSSESTLEPQKWVIQNVSWVGEGTNRRVGRQMRKSVGSSGSQGSCSHRTFMWFYKKSFKLLLSYYNWIFQSQ